MPSSHPRPSPTALVLTALLAAPACASRAPRTPPASPPTAQAAPSQTRTVIHSAEGPFGRLFVVDEDGYRSLRFGSPDGDDQSILSLARPDLLASEYLRYSTLALGALERPARALCVGLGGGVFPMFLRRHLPHLDIDAVDIDPVVVDVARRFFGLREDARLRVTIEDGAAFVRRDSAGWDFVLLDAYSADDVPSHLATTAFFAEVRDHLRPGGVAALNIAVASIERERALLERFAEAFAACRFVRTPKDGNVVAIGRATPLDAPDVLAARVRRLERGARFPFEISPATAALRPCRP